MNVKQLTKCDTFFSYFCHHKFHHGSDNALNVVSAAVGKKVLRGEVKTIVSYTFSFSDDISFHDYM